jgi:hypothetical protein
VEDAERSVGGGDTVVLFNSLGQERSEYIELPLVNGSSSTSLTVVDAATKVAVPSAVIAAVPALFPQDGSFAHGPTIVFKATIPPLSIARYAVVAGSGSGTADSPAQWKCTSPPGALDPSSVSDASDTTISGANVSVQFSGVTGRISAMTVAGASRNISQRYVTHPKATSHTPRLRHTPHFHPTQGYVTTPFSSNPRLRHHHQGYVTLFQGYATQPQPCVTLFQACFIQAYACVTLLQACVTLLQACATLLQACVANFHRLSLRGTAFVCSCL